MEFLMIFLIITLIIINKENKEESILEDNFGTAIADELPIKYSEVDLSMYDDVDLLNDNSILLNNNTNNKDNPLNVVVKNPIFDTSKIQEYKGTETTEKMEFRPNKWTEFIGQEDAKEKAKTIMAKAKRGIKAHLLVDGIKGHGKTSYIELLAKDLNAKLIQRIGKQIDEDSLLDIINEINTSKEEFVIFFVDEIDTMDWKVIKILNPIIEQFKINNKQIKPFIFACATINKHILIKNNPDTLDRIPPSAHIKFKRYNVKELHKIIKQCKENLYPDDEVSDDVIDKIAKNCKYNPRTSQALLDDYIVVKDIDKVLKDCGIIKDGLTHVDVKILRALNSSSRAMGCNAVALKCGLSPKEYEREFEPFLYEFGYINRIPSRVISEKGKEFLNEIKKQRSIK